MSDQMPSNKSSCLRTHQLATLLVLLPVCSALSGCVVVGASSRGGLFVWPGGIGLLVILLVVFLLMRRR